jgi:hypothetical protein
VTLVHKGNIMKFTEGAFMQWGYEVAAEALRRHPLDGGPWHTLKNPKTGNEIIIKDVIADAFLQQILTRPAEYSVIATMNLNGDYISDALAACVGGIGIAPGANINYDTGHAIFEATHGTAPKYAGQDKVNPGSVILSGVLMLEHMGWQEAADLIVKGIEGAISAKTVTYDFERLMDGATLLKCSEFGDPLRMRPMRILGKHCTPAGAFAAIQQIMVRLTPSCQRFGPSTPIDDVLPRGSQKHKLWRRANYAAQGALPRLLPPPDPSWWLAVCSYGLLATLLRICVLDCYSSSFTLAIPLWIVLLLIWGITADLRDKPLPNQIRTFGDLARAMAGEGVSPTTADE